MGNITSQDEEMKIVKAAEEAQVQGKRRSERLIKEITMTIQEKNEEMAKKRNLEGLYSDIDKAEIGKGVDQMLKVATEFLATKKTKYPTATVGQDVKDGQGI